jgi:hypothetical protein
MKRQADEYCDDYIESDSRDDPKISPHQERVDDIGKNQQGDYGSNTAGLGSRESG